MNILILGGGAREHAIAWKLRQSPLVNDLFCAPGNGGIQEIAEIISMRADDGAAIRSFAQKNQVDLVFVGPEQPLVFGIADVLRKDGLRVFGPNRAAAEIEGSKAFAKAFMDRWRIPTASHRVFSRDEFSIAHDYVARQKVPIVIKADGLAAGKGSFVCESYEESKEVINDIFIKDKFGVSGSRIVIEEFLKGDEASIFAFTDGKHIIVLPPAQDYKRLLDDDRGKNTGGMGAYAPTALVDDLLLDRIIDEIILPTIHGLASEERLYSGCLYAGLMVTESGPKVVEFNVRLGDPEAQVVLPVIDEDVAELALACATGDLGTDAVLKPSRAATCVVMASKGYPDEYEVGKEIFGLEQFHGRSDVVIFHGGTRREGEQYVTSGGRVLSITGIADDEDLPKAISTAYGAVNAITFAGAQFRSDIGAKGIRYLMQRRHSA
ncbi:MAG: phosphoribosylamine--glycine ligase [Bacteroidota bacterium]